jgi:hypothetical protein
MQIKNITKENIADKKHRSVFSKLLSSKAPKLECGFTLLFASLISSLVFTIGIAILNISLKQLSLTSAGRESQQAFYSADAGVECALFLDRGAGDSNCQAGFFGVASSTASSGISVCDTDSTNYTPSDSQKCFGQVVDISRNLVSGTNGVSSIFSITSNPETDICFSVTVTKSPNNSNFNDMQSVVESRGYNRCNPDNNPDLTVYERAIKTYNY